MLRLSPIMVISRLIEIFLAAGAVQGFFLALVLNTRKNKRTRSNKLLSALLIVLSAAVLHSLLAPSFPDLHIGEPLVFFIGPLLCFYVYEVTGFRSISGRDALHFLPFVLVLLFLTPVWTGIPTTFAEFLFRNGPPINIVLWTLIVLQYGYYWWRIVSALHRHRSAVESEFSNLEGKTLSWLFLFLHIFGAFLLVLVLTLAIVFHSNQYDLVRTLVSLGLSASVFVIGYNGLFQEKVFSPASLSSEMENNRRSLRSEGASSENNNESMKRLTAYMDSAKPYLQEWLTLTELAAKLGMTRNRLSHLINSELGENFYSFVNRYRVEEAKRLLADPKNASFTILSLAYEAGFPSKSSFHSVFKESTGLTPSGYRKTLQ